MSFRGLSPSPQPPQRFLGGLMAISFRSMTRPLPPMFFGRTAAGGCDAGEREVIATKIGA